NELERERFGLQLGQGVAGKVAESLQGVIVNDYRTRPGVPPEVLARTKVTAMMAEPLLYRDRLVGVIHMDTEEAGIAFTEQDHELLRLVAPQAAIAIENARLHEAVTRRAEQLANLTDLTQMVTAVLEPAALAQQILRAAQTLIPGAAGRLWEAEEDALRLVASAGLQDPAGGDRVRFRQGEGVAGLAVATRHPVIIADVTGDPRFVNKAWARAEGLVSGIVLPLAHRDQALGVLGLYTRSPHVFTPDEVRLLTAFAAQAAIAMANAQLYAASDGQRRQLEAAQAVTTEIIHELEVTRVLDLILDRAMGLLNTRSGAVFLWDAAAQVLVPQAHVGLGDWYGDVRHPLGEGIVGAVAQRRAGLIVNDYPASPYVVKELQHRTGVQRAICAPLLYRDRLIGVLILRDKQSGAPFQEADLALLRLFADQAAIAIENARLYTATQQELAMRKQAEAALLSRTRQLEAVHLVSAEITRELNLDRLLGLILRRAADLMGAPAGALSLWDEERQVLGSRVRFGEMFGTLPQRPLALGEGMLGRVAASRQGLLVNDYRTWPGARPDTLTHTGVTAGLAEPLLYRERLIGVINLVHGVGGGTFTPEHAALLRLFADQAAIAIENARLYTEATQSLHALHQAQDTLVQTEKLRALGQMASGIAHDLNNKLMVILGQAELLRLTVPHPALEQELAPLEAAATASVAVVRQILDFGRQHASVPHTPIALAPVVQGALTLTQAQWKDAAERQGVPITIHTALAGLPPVLGQAAELREALVQLIGNAVEAMPTGGSLTVAGRLVPKGTGEPANRGIGERSAPILRRPDAPSPTEGESVELTVTDTGVGIPAEIQPRIFEPFFTTKGVQRTGLGLAVVYGTLQRHGGTITVASTPGQGTTFTLRLPAAVAVQAAAPPAPVPARAGVTPCRLLIIDDEPKVRSTLASLLRAVGHTVTEAASGPAGLALLGTIPVDCVLTDLGMPEMTGWEVAKAVNASWPHLPVLLLTGWGDQAADVPPGHRVARVLSKPIRREQLLAVIAEVTGGL
ncbi:MAG TPA: GAF domain-containing protein, partial [Candidatus Methylomirabilis sp.]